MPQLDPPQEATLPPGGPQAKLPRGAQRAVERRRGPLLGRKEFREAGHPEPFEAPAPKPVVQVVLEVTRVQQGLQKEKLWKVQKHNGPPVRPGPETLEQPLLPHKGRDEVRGADGKPPLEQRLRLSLLRDHLGQP